jgi:hypothetical protein
MAYRRRQRSEGAVNKYANGLRHLRNLFRLEPPPGAAVCAARMAVKEVSTRDYHTTNWTGRRLWDVTLEVAAGFISACHQEMLPFDTACAQSHGWQAHHRREMHRAALAPSNLPLAADDSFLLGCWLALS